jgi:hypothetical protein
MELDVAKEAVERNRKLGKKPPAPSKTSLRIERARIVVRHAGRSFNYKHHVFIAKLKRGEIWALNYLSLTAKVAVTPLFEMWEPDPGTATKPAKTLTQHTIDLLNRVTTEWTALPFYLDTQYLGNPGAPSPANANTVFSIARKLNLDVVPVTSPFFPPQFQQVIRNVIAADERGVMFRLPINFFDDLQNVSGYLNGLVSALGTSRSQVDILIDLKFRPSVGEVQQLGDYALNNLPFINEWRTVTLASGCFPQSISTAPLGSWVPFIRSDWLGWSAVSARRAGLGVRIPAYGDYGIRCGGVPAFIPNTPDPNLRYTAPQTIWVRKEPKTLGSMQVICADLIGQQFYSGPAFSEGDAQIALKAATTNPTNGQAEQWIQWCTNHHLELTASQIQSLP